MKALTSLQISKEAELSYRHENRPKVATSGVESSGLFASLFFSGKLQNYSEAMQGLRLSSVFNQKFVAGLQLEIQHRVYNTSCRPLPEFPCGHSRNIAITRYGW